MQCVDAGAGLASRAWTTSSEYIAGFIVNQLHLEVGIARNDAIRENTFALFVGMRTRTATFIVVKPGASKSLSLDLLTGLQPPIRSNTEPQPSSVSFKTRVVVDEQRKSVTCLPPLRFFWLSSWSVQRSIQRLLFSVLCGKRNMDKEQRTKNKKNKEKFDSNWQKHIFVAVAPPTRSLCGGFLHRANVCEWQVRPSFLESPLTECALPCFCWAPRASSSSPRSYRAASVSCYVSLDVLQQVSLTPCRTEWPSFFRLFRQRQLIVFATSALHQQGSAAMPPMSWSSHKVKRSVSASLAGEVFMMSEGLAECEWISCVLESAVYQDYEPSLHRRKSISLPVEPTVTVMKADSHLQIDPSTVCVVDTNSAFDHLVRESTGGHCRRTAQELCVIRRSMQTLRARCRWVPHEWMVVDALTKRHGNSVTMLRLLRDNRGRRSRAGDEKGVP